MSGCILLWRNLRDKQLFYTESRPFCPLGAWVDMLMLANWKDNVWHGETIERGSFVTSQPILAKRWGWSRSKVQRFLDRLSTEQRIEQQANNRRTKIRITNYEQYQEFNGNSEQVANKKPNKKPDSKVGTTNEGIYITKNEEERETAPLVQFGDVLRMTQAEWDQLLKDFSIILLSQERPEMDLWLKDADTPNARKYRKPNHNHYLFARNWLRDKRVTLPGQQKPNLSFKNQRELEVFSRINQQAPNGKNQDFSNAQSITGPVQRGNRRLPGGGVVDSAEGRGRNGSAAGNRKAFARAGEIIPTDYRRVSSGGADAPSQGGLVDADTEGTGNADRE